MAKNNTALIVVGIIVIAFVVLSLNPEFNFSMLSGEQAWDTTNYYNQSQTQLPASDSHAPSSMYAVVQPNTISQGQRVIGVVTSDGYKYPITVNARHMGQGTTQTFGGLLDDTGRFLISQTISLPGSWEFWTTAGAVSSNRADLTVLGIATTSDRASVSKSLSPTCNIGVYSSTSGNVAIIANDPVHFISVPLTNTVVNSGGYGTVNVDLSSLAQGSYEIDALINGQTASGFGGACWVTVGR